MIESFNQIDVYLTEQKAKQTVDSH